MDLPILPDGLRFLLVPFLYFGELFVVKGTVFLHMDLSLVWCPWADRVLEFEDKPPQFLSLLTGPS